MPAQPQYVHRRLEGFSMMTIVCSFLFPIGLQGARVAASPRAAALVVLGNTYATLVKMLLIDTGVAEPRHHAILRGRERELAGLKSRRPSQTTAPREPPRLLRRPSLGLSNPKQRLISSEAKDASWKVARRAAQK